MNINYLEGQCNPFYKPFWFLTVKFSPFEEGQLFSLRLEIHERKRFLLDEAKFNELEKRGYERKKVELYISYLFAENSIYFDHDPLNLWVVADKGILSELDNWSANQQEVALR